MAYRYDRAACAYFQVWEGYYCRITADSLLFYRLDVATHFSAGGGSSSLPAKRRSDTTRVALAAYAYTFLPPDTLLLSSSQPLLVAPVSSLSGYRLSCPDDAIIINGKEAADNGSIRSSLND